MPVSVESWAQDRAFPARLLFSRAFASFCQFCQLAHTPSLVYAEYFTTMLYQNCHDATLTQTHAQALIGLAIEQGFGLRGEQGRILPGWALAMQGDPGEGIALILQGLEAQQHVGGPELGRPFVLALLAEAYGQAKQPEIGLHA